MYNAILLVLVIGIAGKLATIEDRNPYLWGIGTGAVAVALMVGLDLFSLFAHILALFAEFVALWIAKARDARKAGKRF